MSTQSCAAHFPRCPGEDVYRRKDAGPQYQVVVQRCTQVHNHQGKASTDDGGAVLHGLLQQGFLHQIGKYCGVNHAAEHKIQHRQGHQVGVGQQCHNACHHRPGKHNSGSYLGRSNLLENLRRGPAHQKTDDNGQRHHQKHQIAGNGAPCRLVQNNSHHRQKHANGNHIVHNRQGNQGFGNRAIGFVLRHDGQSRGRGCSQGNSPKNQSQEDGNIHEVKNQGKHQADHKESHQGLGQGDDHNLLAVTAHSPPDHLCAQHQPHAAFQNGNQGMIDRCVQNLLAE